MNTALIFDLDGTLWNSTGSACDIWNRLLTKHPEVSLTMTQDLAKSLMGKTMEAIGECLFPMLSKEAQDQLMDEFGVEEVLYLEEHGAILYDGVAEVIPKLAEKYLLYMVSNCQDGYVPAFLKAHGMEAYFKDIEMSGRTGMEKGDNIRLLMERNGITKAVYIGDTEGDEKASCMAGIPFIYAAYGFGTAIAPDAVIDHIGKLESQLQILHCVGEDSLI